MLRYKIALCCFLVSVLFAPELPAARKANKRARQHHFNVNFFQLDEKLGIEDALKHAHLSEPERKFLQAYLASKNSNWSEALAIANEGLSLLGNLHDFPFDDLQALQAQSLIHLDRTAEAQFPTAFSERKTFWQDIADELHFADLLHKKQFSAAEKWLKNYNSANVYQRKAKYELQLRLEKTRQSPKFKILLEDYLLDAQSYYDFDLRLRFVEQLLPNEGKTYRERFLQPLHRLELAHQFYNTQHWHDALELLEGLENEALSPGLRAEQLWLWGTALSRLHHYEEGIEYLEKARNMPASAPFRNDILARLAMTYAKANQRDKVYEIRQAFLQEARKSRRKRIVIENIFSLAVFQLDQKEYVDARKSFQEIVLLEPKHQLALRSQWFVMWSYYLEGKYPQAIATADILLKKKNLDNFFREQVVFWQAKAYEKNKQQKNAENLYKEIVKRHDSQYYSTLASLCLQGKKFSSFVEEELLQSKTWKSSSKMPEHFKANDLSQRWLRLVQMGLLAEVRQEMDQASLQKIQASEDNIQLAWHIGAAKAACRWLQGLAKTDIKYGPNRTQCALMPFHEVVQQAIWNPDVHPYLVSGLMKAESGFDSNIVSPAGAIGLMQLMPTTAKHVHERYYYKFPFVSARLFDPAANISYGVRYLEKLAEDFPKDPTSWIAAYNAGEEAVARWKKERPELELEEFIESIPYKETNFYVKKVLANFWLAQKAMD